MQVISRHIVSAILSVYTTKRSKKERPPKGRYQSIFKVSTVFSWPQPCCLEGGALWFDNTNAQTLALALTREFWVALRISARVIQAVYTPKRRKTRVSGQLFLTLWKWFGLSLPVLSVVDEIMSKNAAVVIFKVVLRLLFKYNSLVYKTCAPGKANMFAICKNTTSNLDFWRPFSVSLPRLLTPL